MRINEIRAAAWQAVRRAAPPASVAHAAKAAAAAHGDDAEATHHSAVYTAQALCAWCTARGQDPKEAVFKALTATGLAQDQIPQYAARAAVHAAAESALRRGLPHEAVCHASGPWGDRTAGRGVAAVAVGGGGCGRQGPVPQGETRRQTPSPGLL